MCEISFRLKLICEDHIQKHITVENVTSVYVSTSAVSRRLKSYCLDFIVERLGDVRATGTFIRKQTSIETTFQQTVISLFERYRGVCLQRISSSYCNPQS